MLTSDEKNLGKLRQEGLDLDRFLKETDDEKMKLFIEQLQGRLEGTTG